MGSNGSDRETLLFLDFNEKLPIEQLLQNKIFIRLANLKEKNPLIQVNDLIFKGTYDYSMGTNLFFKKSPNEGPCEFPFKNSTKFKLDLVNSQMKILTCSKMKVQPTAAQLPANQESIKFNFNWDYKELLKRFENGTLDLQDMVITEEEQKDDQKPEEELLQNIYKTYENVPEIEPIETIESIEETSSEISDNMDVSENNKIEEPSEELKEAYEELQILARTPVKRETVPENCVSDPQFKNEYDYKSIECKVLERPLFSYRKSEIGTLEECINMQRCITLGLLSPSDSHPRVLTQEEKKILMRVENFENLDLRARYSVLVSHMEELEKQVNLNSPEQNCTKDEFGRTPQDTLHIFKRLVAALEKRIK